MRLIGIHYKCKCMEREGSFQIEERYAGEDLDTFMNRLRHSLRSDHHRRSPLCLSPKTEYIKIPVHKEEGVGRKIGGT